MKCKGKAGPRKRGLDMQRNSQSQRCKGIAWPCQGKVKQGVAKEMLGLEAQWQSKALKCEGKAWPRKRGLDMQRKSVALIA